MNLIFCKKKVFISASSNGIGYATARVLAREGATVIINGRDKHKLFRKREMLIEETGNNKIFVFEGDMSSQEDIERLRQYVSKEHGTLDSLILCVGSGKPIKVSRLDIEEWKQSFDTNLFSAVRMISTFDRMWTVTGGSIVMVSSLAGISRIGAPYAYAAAKDAIISFTKYLSDDYAKRNIRVNCVIPGNIYFHGGRWEELRNADPDSVDCYINENVPLKRFGTPEDVANAIAFLASDAASFITGSSLVVDGGQNRGLR